MKHLKNFVTKLGLAGELLSFLWSQKLWWMIPMVVVLVAFGLFLMVAQSVPIIHFVYPLF